MQKSKKKEKQKPKYNMWQNTAFMIALACREKEKKVLVLGVFAAVFAVALNLIGIYVTPTILAAVESRAPVWELILTILLFVGLQMLCSAIFSYIGTNTPYGRTQVRSALIRDLNRKAATTSYPNLGDERFRKLYSKASEATSSNHQATEAVWISLTDLFKNLLGFMLYMLLLFSVEPFLAIVITVTTLVGYSVSKHLVEYEYRHWEEVAEYSNKMWYINGRARDPASAKDIRIFGLRPWLEEVSAKAMEAYMAFYKKANGIYVWGRIVDLVLTFARNGIAYAYLLHLTLENGLSAAQFLLYFSAVGGFAGWVSGFILDLSALHSQSIGISTVRECIEYPESFDFEGGETLEPDKDTKYEIRLKNVSFRYPESEKFVLQNIDLTLHPDEKLAVVGLNGAGKTTLVKLICGFYDPTEGQVLLNGKDIRDFNRRDYYKMFSAVFQDFSLLAGTIAANVAQSEDDIGMEKVKACTRQAGLLSKIESLPDGFETYLNRNVYENAIMLSGGETQRLMLARALYKDAPVILLDEPTAALDPIAEAEMYQKYNEMTLGKSSVYISHRLASTRFCDRIIFIEDSHIAEEGTHEELLARGGRYAELFAVQSKYYREEDTGNEEKEG